MSGVRRSGRDWAYRKQRQILAWEEDSGRGLNLSSFLGLRVMMMVEVSHSSQ